MTHRSPLVTLAGLVVAFGLMFGVNLASSAPRGSYGGGPTSASTAPPSTAPTPSASAASATESTAPSESPSPSAPPSSSATEPEESKFPAKVVYAGRIRDGSAAIAVAVRGNRAAAYLCDGRSVEAWLAGKVDEDEITLRSGRGSRLQAALRGNQLRGRIKVGGGAELSFRINEAGKPAGLYRARKSATTIGWIVLPDGSQVGIETTGERSTAAPKLDPDQPQVQVGGETLEASPVEGDERI